MKKNVAGQKIGAQLVSKTDGSPVTTGTTTIYITGDAGTQAVGTVGAGACTHEGNGYWTYSPDIAETNYDLIAFTFVNAAACNPTVQVETSYPQTVDSVVMLTLITKILRNKLISDPVTGIMTLYDDDSTTPYLTAQLYKNAGGTITYNGTGAERRQRLA